LAENNSKNYFLFLKPLITSKLINLYSQISEVIFEHSDWLLPAMVFSLGFQGSSLLLSPNFIILDTMILTDQNFNLIFPSYYSGLLEKKSTVNAFTYPEFRNFFISLYKAIDQLSII